MTKQEEKARFAEFINSLSRGSYLRPMMEQIQQEVENAIINDLEFVSFTEQVEAVRAHMAEIAALQNRLNELKADCRKLDTERARIASGLDQLRSEARSLAKLAMA